jgi:hypothetical protein
MKTQILAALEANALQPAARLNAASAANDRLKYVFSLLQMALTYAEHPDQLPVSLKRKRLACPRLEINLDHRQCKIGDTLVHEGEFLSLDGNIGEVHLGRLTLVTEHPERALAAVAGWRRSAAVPELSVG